MAWLDDQACDRIGHHPIHNKVAGIIIPGVEIDEPPGKGLHRHVQARAVFVISPVPGGGTFAFAYEVPAGRYNPTVQDGLDHRICGGNARRKPRRPWDRLAVLLEVGDVEQLERVRTEKIGDVRHPGRKAPPLKVARFELYRLPPVHGVNHIDELPVHLAPGDLLLAQDDIQAVSTVTEVQLAHDALEVMVGAQGLAASLLCYHIPAARRKLSTLVTSMFGEIW